MESLQVHALNWDVEPNFVETDRTQIRAWAFDSKTNIHLLRIEDFPTFCYIELPRYVNAREYNWDVPSIVNFTTQVSKMLKGDAPIKALFHNNRRKLYYYQMGKTYCFLQLFFRTINAMNHCKNLLSKPRFFENFGKLACSVHEADVSIVRKLLTERNCGYAQWFKIDGIPVPEDEKISTLDREYRVKWETLTPMDASETKGMIAKPSVLAYDLETFSPNYRAMPVDSDSRCYIAMCSCTFVPKNTTEYQKYIIVYGRCKPIEGVEIIFVDTEMELIDAFQDLIKKLDPDVIIGYNIFGYDNKYVDTRLGLRLKKWKPCTRILGKAPVLKSKEWESGAYGFNEVHNLLFDGRIMIDLLKIVRREHKLSRYDLDTVAKHFLKRSKIKIKMPEMFAAIEGYHKVKNSGDTVAIDKAEIELTRFVEYCVRDSDVVMDLYSKLNTWIALTELSSIVGVPIMDTFAAGQQIRCYSQICDKAAKMGIIVDKRSYNKVPFKGGLVGELEPGLYFYIITLDFNSLYPSIIRAFNLCYTTLVPPELMDKVPDEDCHICHFFQDEAEEGSDEDDDDDDNQRRKRKNKKKNVPTKQVEYTYKYVKAHVQPGLLPELEGYLVGSRNRIKGEMKGAAALVKELAGKMKEATDPEEKKQLEAKLNSAETDLKILDARQLGLKVSANSLYGFLSAETLYIIEIGRTVTAYGRQIITECKNYVEEKYKDKGARVVYGDSVTGDTPILIRENGVTRWIYINELADFGNDSNEKQHIPISDSFEVWSDKGWTRIQSCMRHKTQKKIFRVLTHTGVVDVTEDHSLLLPSGVEVTPNQVSVGTELLHSDLPVIDFTSDFCLEFTGGKLEIARVYHFALSRGHKMCIEIDQNTYRLRSCDCDIFNSNQIIAIIPLGACDDYVYDLETANHHFAAGIGRMVVHNTDSIMIDLGIKDPSELDYWGHFIAQELSDRYPDPLRLEFEKGSHAIYFTKKKYCMLLLKKGKMVFLTEENGEIMKEEDGTPMLDERCILVKGVCPARRDNCQYTRDLFYRILKRVFLQRPIEVIFDLIIDAVIDLIENKVPIDDLEVVRGLGHKYKDPNFMMSVFANNIRAAGKIANPGDRLPYVIVEGPETNVGPRMRLTEMFLESFETDKPEKIDVKYYIENLMKNPIEQLFQVGCKIELATLLEWSERTKYPLGYKPRSRKHFVAIDKPLKMMARMYEDGVDLRTLKPWFRKVVEVVRTPVIELEIVG